MTASSLSSGRPNIVFMRRSDMTDTRIESDGLGEIAIQADKLWGAQTQRSLHYFSIGRELMPREMIEAYAIVKRACASANHQSGRLGETQCRLITTVCDEILAGQHADMFPLHVWMTGSGTQFNMNINEVISNRACQLSGEALGSKRPVHPNDHVNMSQSSNDNFPTAMHVAVVLGSRRRLVPALTRLAESIEPRPKSGRISSRLAAPICRMPCRSRWVRNSTAMPVCCAKTSPAFRKPRKVSTSRSWRHRTRHRHQYRCPLCWSRLR